MKKKIFKIILFNSTIFIILLFIIDNIIHFYPYNFSKNFVELLSNKTKLKFKLHHQNDSINFYDEYIFYYKPNIKINSYLMSDNFGYINPKKIDFTEDKPKLIIFGDSFTYEISRELRLHLKDFNVYNLGIAGQGITHWKYHLKRFRQKYNINENRDIILLNYYEGNDLEDSLRANLLLQNGYTNSVYYPTNPFFKIKDYKKKISFFDESYSILRYIYIRLKNYQSLIALNSSKDKSILVNSAPLINYKNCKIKIGYGEEPKKYDILRDKNNTVKTELKNFLKDLSSNQKIYFNYIPSNITVFKKNLSDNLKFNNSEKIHKSNIKTLTSFLSKIENIKLINLTDQIILKSATNFIYPCNASNSHFNKMGYEIFSKMIIQELNIKIE